MNIERCPTCDSPSPNLHPAVQYEGEVQMCADQWHASTEEGRRVLDRELLREPLELPEEDE
jgi:hypothetical protein